MLMYCCEVCYNEVDVDAEEMIFTRKFSLYGNTVCVKCAASVAEKAEPEYTQEELDRMD